FSGRFVYRIRLDRENASRVYATTINNTTGGGFFFVSNDGGASWQDSMRNMPPRLIGYSILQDERDGNIRPLRPLELAPDVQLWASPRTWRLFPNRLMKWCRFPMRDDRACLQLPITESIVLSTW